VATRWEGVNTSNDGELLFNREVGTVKVSHTPKGGGEEEKQRGIGVGVGKNRSNLGEEAKKIHLAFVRVLGAIPRWEKQLISQKLYLPSQKKVGKNF